jgi:AraC-like DNA-binding protein/quercetin dioxygenase-like cupin family protein
MSINSRLVFEEGKLGIPGVHSIGMYNYGAAKAGLPPHQHDGCVEINFQVKGRQVFRVEEKTYHLKGGEQFISFPNEIHDTGDQPEDKGVNYWLILNVTRERERFLFLAPAMARKLIADLLSLSSRHFIAAHESCLIFEWAVRTLQKITVPHECTGIFQTNNGIESSIVKGRKRKQAAFDDSIQLLEVATNIVNYVTQTIAASKANVRSISPVISASLDFIAQNDRAWLSVSQVAEEIHLSKSKFQKLFREEIGMTPGEYMLRQKVESAKKLLSKPDCYIADLAHHLGFSSSQYFATVFRRFSNLTPSDRSRYR